MNDEVDPLVDPEMDPGTKEAAEKVVVQLQRYKQLAWAIINTKNAGPPLLAQTYIHTELATAKFIAMETLLFKKLGITQKEFLEEVANQLDQLLGFAQIERKCIITPDGVIPEEIADGNQRPGSTH